jgi:3-oxoacyl-[acyl-carrier protein] reductase
MSVTGPLLGKRVLITGAATGIGRAAAETLAMAGAQVIINCKDDAQLAEAEGFAAALRAAGATVFCVHADLTDSAALDHLFAQSLALLGGLDIVISNAAGETNLAPIAETSEADYDRCMALNARAQFFVLQRAARHLTDGGRIIVMSSSTVASPYAGTACYGGAKRAAELYARVLAAELGPRSITVNVVAPGPTDTDTMRAQTPPERLEQVASMIPLGRIGRPADIAVTIAFLASDQSRWITRQILQVGGGIV